MHFQAFEQFLALTVRLSAIKHVTSSSALANFDIFAKEKIRPRSLDIILNKIPELESLGHKMVSQTRDLFSLIQAHVSLSVRLPFYVNLYAHYCFQTQAGCHLLINAIILHVMSILSDAEVDVSMVPDFWMKLMQFEAIATSYGGFVDFLIVKGPPINIGK